MIASIGEILLRGLPVDELVRPGGLIVGRPALDFSGTGGSEVKFPVNRTDRRAFGNQQKEVAMPNTDFAGIAVVRRRLAVGLLLGLAACAPLPVVPETAPPPLAAAPPRYALQPGDQLEVKFLYNPELNEQVTIQPDGRFTLPMAPDTIAAGRTLDEVTQNLNSAYSRELRDPRIVVQLKNALPTRIYVGGEVVSPGEYINVGPPLTFAQAIARAGGLKNSANQERIIIVRREPGGRATPYGVNFVDAAGGVEGADVVLAPYDHVFVPRTGVANVYLAYQQYFQQFLPSSLGIAISP